MGITKKMTNFVAIYWY